MVVDQLRRSFAVTKKNLAIYYMKGPVLIFGIILPAFLFLAFSIGRDMPVSFLIPGLTGMTLFFTASSVGPVITPWETRQKTLERLVSAPVSMWTIILGDVTASFLFGVGVSLVPILTGAYLLGLGIITCELIVGTLLAAFCFSAFASVLSAPPTNTPSETMMVGTLIKFPLIFISGIFVPVSEMVGWSRVLSLVSPLTYYTDLVRHSVQGANYFPPLLDMAVLLIYSALFFVVAVKWHEKSLENRF